MSTGGDSTSPAEPEVLAATKHALFPTDADDAYAVTDTQFAREEWRTDYRIDEQVRDVLTPFNHVRLGTGYPDLVGVGSLPDRFLIDADTTAGNTSDGSPLIAVEAKGYAQGDVDAKQGVTQAHDRLADANVVYLSAPADAITRDVRALARDLNVGVLAVSGNNIKVLEAPRVVGAKTPDAARAIQFQATAQGVANQSFGLNHPKNYLAYPLAVSHPDPTEAVMERHVVGAVDAAQQGAEFLGLVRSTPQGVALTNLGEEIVRYATELEDGIDAAVQRFENWQRSRDRFVDIAEEWGTLARWVVFEYPATELLVEELQRLHDHGNSAPTLREFVLALYERHPAFAVEVFIRGTDDARERVFQSEATVDRAALADGDVYASPTVFQLKAMLYHAGILTERGAEPNRLDPTEDVWRLRRAV